MFRYALDVGGSTWDVRKGIIVLANNLQLNVCFLLHFITLLFLHSITSTLSSLMPWVWHAIVSKYPIKCLDEVWNHINRFQSHVLALCFLQLWSLSFQWKRVTVLRSLWSELGSCWRQVTRPISNMPQKSHFASKLSFRYRPVISQSMRLCIIQSMVSPQLLSTASSEWD